MTPQQQKFSCLVISDIHYNLDNVKSLTLQYQRGHMKTSSSDSKDSVPTSGGDHATENSSTGATRKRLSESLQEHLHLKHSPNKVPFDYIFCLGDIGNLKGEQFKSQDEIESCKNRIEAILVELQKLVRRKLIVLLGNHDHFSMLEEKKRWNNDKMCLLQGELLVPSESEHSREDSNLPPFAMFVHGGSPPGYFLADPSKPRIKGYPYETRQEFNKHLDETMERIQWEKRLSPGQQVLWLTHCGPTESASSVTNIKNEGEVESGSERYRYWIRKWKERNEILGWIHGHCHDGAGVHFVTDGGVPVYNGAAFTNGNFITMNIEQDSNKWKITEERLHNLSAEKK